MDKKLTLPDFLKLLTSNNVPMPKAMAVASKVFKEYNTTALLVQLDDAKLQVLGVKDKDLRKLVLAAVRKARDSRPTRKPRSEGDSDAQQVAGPSGSKYPSTVQILITPKKRKRDDDLNELLPEAPPDEASAYGSMDFNDVLDEEVLKVKSTVTNRAPLMTAWATIVAERLGFEREEALSIGSVYTEMNAVAKGVSLGIVDRSRQKEMDPISGGQQPYVDLMGKRRPLYKTQSSKWRALVSGSPAIPSTAFSYISRAFRQTTPYIVGALRLLAASYSPQELNKVGFSLYAEFRPIVDGWGKRGEVRCERILSLRKKGSGDTLDTPISDVQRSDSQGVSGEHPSKKARTFTLQWRV
ncbi:hypothetical protein L210DRAFT_3469664 [Boletus edulis BED1]|uniref:SAM domain-containing protein n=1 Tax=Boletus edulis BED1 TaxID=1328754 RepID=A0AAD4GL48_BOLED|nr:hypothetical protein L210DRAFT_3469664 [Boletus edulis BED1]